MNKDKLLWNVMRISAWATILFPILKLTDVLTISWWYILIPFFITTSILDWFVTGN